MQRNVTARLAPIPLINQHIINNTPIILPSNPVPQGDGVRNIIEERNKKSSVALQPTPQIKCPK